MIPARYGSTRLPAKPLAPIAGKPLVQHVHEGAVGSALFDDVVVATDDERIARTVESFGGAVVMTRPDHPSGTDRVAEVARDRAGWEIVVNIQGDLPFVGRGLLEGAVERMRAAPEIPMATVSVPLPSRAAWLDPNVVKVVVDREGFALYFSRAPIPAWRGDDGGEPEGRQHVGIYAYRRDFLLELAGWAPTPLERRESLEQLRVLERGRRIFVAEAEAAVVEVDTAEDVERAERIAEAAGGRA